MAFIVPQFGNYNNYLTWAEGRNYDFLTILTCDETPTLLKRNPVGITDTNKRRARHEVYGGSISSITLKVKFFLLDGFGGQIIKDAYNIDFTRADVSIAIYKKNNLSDFDLWYTGKIDFSPNSFDYKVDANGEYIECNIIEGGSVTELLANDETEISIEDIKNIWGETITDIAKTVIHLTPIDIFSLAESTTTFVQVVGGYAAGVNGVEDRNFEGGILVTNNIGTDATMTPTDGVLYNNSSSSTFEVKVEALLPVHIEYDTIDASETFDLYIDILDSSDVLVERIYTKHWVQTGNSGIISETLNISIDYKNLLPGYKIHYWFRITYNTISGSAYWDVILTNTYLRVIQNSPSPIATSNCEAYILSNAFKKLVRILTKTAELDFNVGDSGLDYLTTGYGIRQFQALNARVTFRRLFETLNVYAGVILKYNATTDRFSINKRSTGFSGLGSDLGTIDNLSISPNSESMFNELKIGWPEPEGDEFQTAYEFIGTNTYSTTNLFKNSKALIAHYRADSKNIELLRRYPYLNYGKIEKKGDNDIFIIRCNGSRYPRLGSSYNAVGFLGIEQYYNIGLSQWYCVKNNGDIVRACLYGSSDILTFRSAKNLNEATFEDVPSDIINIFGDFETAKAIPLPYIPKKCEFDAIFTDAFKTVLDLHPYDYFTFQDSKGKLYTLFIDESEPVEDEKKIKIIGKLRTE